MLETEITTRNQLEEKIRNTPCLLAYFTAPQCGVCTVIKPKILAMIQEKFPKLAFCRIDCEAHRDIAGQYMVTAVPTVVLYFDGAEGARFSRSFSIAALEQALARPYALLMGD